jgi:hypothetical protein
LGKEIIYSCLLSFLLSPHCIITINGQLHCAGCKDYACAAFQKFPRFFIQYVNISLIKKAAGMPIAIFNAFLYRKNLSAAL